MDIVSGIALQVVLVAAGFYVLYWVIRRAVRAGIRDARADAAPGPHPDSGAGPASGSEPAVAVDASPTTSTRAAPGSRERR